MFGPENMTFETRAGGHNFFIQDHANTLARLRQWWGAVAAGTAGSPAVVEPFRD